MVEDIRDAFRLAQDRYNRMRIPVYIIRTEHGFLLATQAELPQLSLQFDTFDIVHIEGNEV
jgi:hydroxypyruvate isomerase